MGNNNLDHLQDLFRMAQESMHMNFSIGSPDHDFWEYKDMHRFFGYSTAKNDPNLLVGGKQLHEIFRETFWWYSGTERYKADLIKRKFPDINLPSLAAIPTDIAPDVLLAEALKKVEIANEMQEISDKFTAYNPDFIHKQDFQAMMYDFYRHRFCVGDSYQFYRYLMTLFCPELADERYLRHESSIQGFSSRTYSTDTPGYSSENFTNLVNIIENLERYNKMLSKTPGELYYKFDLKSNAILKNKNFIIEDLLNYVHYVDYVDDILEPISKNLKITQTLFQAQQMREAFYAGIEKVPHYTPEEFLDLCTNAAFNLSYAIQKDDLESEMFFENFGYENRLFSVFRFKDRTENSRGDLIIRRGCENAELFPEVNIEHLKLQEDKKVLLDSAKSFIYSCEMIKKNQEYVDKYFVGERLTQMNLAMNRARHSTLHQFLSDVFRVELITMPKKFISCFDMWSVCSYYEDPGLNSRYFFR